MHTDSALLTPDEVRALFAPSTTAEGLPARAYFSTEFYEAERQKVFAAGWMGVGFASDMPEVGDARPVSIAGWELLLVRGSDGVIRCFHNVCRHRGMKVTGEACSVRSLRCPYHAWTYDLEGKLTSTPAIAGIRLNESPGINKDNLGLVQVRCDQQFDVIFVNIDGKAPPLDKHLAPVNERLDQSMADFSAVVPASGGRSGRYGYRANWKVVLEGGIEDYHLPFVHRAFTHSADYRTEDGGDVYAGFSSRRSLEDAVRRFEASANDLELPMMPKIRESGIAESVVLYIFPNTVLTCGPYTIATSLIMPKGPEQTEYYAKARFVGEGYTARYDALREKSGLYWKEVFGEDEPIWEAVQALARQRDELKLPTRFSPHWECGMHLFQRHVARRIAPDLAPAA